VNTLYFDESGRKDAVSLRSLKRITQAQDGFVLGNSMVCKLSI
jgi:hypothetical protein